MKVCYWDVATNTQQDRDMTEAEIALAIEEAELAALPVVPAKVTRRQARQALLLSGHLENVPLVIADIQDDTQRALATIEWEDSLEFERQRPLLISLATALGMDSTDLDNIFILAASL